MKITKSSLAIAAVAALLSLSPPANAQTASNSAPAAGRSNPNRGGGIENQLTHLSDELKLTADQKPKVKTILEEQNKKRQELQGDSTLAQADRRAKMQTIRDDTNKKMKEVLTAEQFKKYEEIQQQRRN